MCSVKYIDLIAYQWIYDLKYKVWDAYCKKA